MSTLRVNQTKQEIVCLRLKWRERRGRRAELHRPTQFLRIVRDGQASLALKMRWWHPRLAGRIWRHAESILLNVLPAQFSRCDLFQALHRPCRPVFLEFVQSVTSRCYRQHSCFDRIGAGDVKGSIADDQNFFAAQFCS